MARRKAGDSKVAVGNITRVSGKVSIAGGNIYEGYTAEQVSLLLAQITTNYQRKPFDGRRYNGHINSALSSSLL